MSFRSTNRFIYVAIALLSSNIYSAFSSDESIVSVGESILLTWSSTASSCKAFDDWTGTKTGSGSESIVVSKIQWNLYSINCGGVNEYQYVWANEAVAPVTAPSSSSTNNSSSLASSDSSNTSNLASSDSSNTSASGSSASEDSSNSSIQASESSSISISNSSSDLEVISSEIVKTSLIKTLRFKEYPDFETPTDVDADNTYEITVNVTDGIKTTSKNISIRIQDVSEDVTGMNFTATNGSDNVAPRLRIKLTIPELAYASEVLVLTWKVNQEQTWSNLTQLNATDWELDLELDKYALAGDYAIRQILIKRTSPFDDEITLGDNYLASKGFTTKVTIINPNQDTNPPKVVGIEEISIVNNDGDINTEIQVNIISLVEDEENSLVSAGGYIEGPRGGLQWMTGAISGDQKKVIFSAPLDSRTASGDYKILDIRLTDRAGNYSLYTTSELTSSGFQTTWNISNPISDDIVPEITDLYFTPIGSGTTKEIKVTANLSPQETGIKRLYIQMQSPDNIRIDKDFPVLVSNNTSFDLQFSLPSEFPNGKYTVDYIFVTDKALNKQMYSGSDLEALGIVNFVTFD